MHKIGDDTSTSDVNGEWTEGGAGGTPPATVIKANWLNSIQRELLAVLSRFGLSPTLSDDGQLSEIMRRMKSASGFAPRPTNSPSMAIVVGAGSLFTYQLIETADQTTGTMIAPTVNPRIDRVVINKSSGVVSIITGAESASPTPPAIATGQLPIARIALSVGQSTITTAQITDERGLAAIATIPPPVTDFSGGVAIYASDYGAYLGGFDVDASLPYDGNWHSIGPTGSTGTNHVIWPDLDLVPITAKAVILRFVATSSGTPSGVSGTVSRKIRSRRYGMGIGHAAQECLGFTIPLVAGSSTDSSHTNNFIVPVNDRRFDLNYISKPSVLGVTSTTVLYLVGWLDGLA